MIISVSQCHISVTSTVIILVTYGISQSLSKRTTCETSECHAISSRIADGIDPRVDPCEDFYEFACGNWMRKNKIPDERSWWSPWSISRIHLKSQIRRLMEGDVDETAYASAGIRSVRKVIDLYKGCLDMESRDRVGLSPLREMLDKIGGWPLVDPKWSDENYRWQAAYIYLRSRLGLNFIINMYVDVDSKNTSRRIIYLDRPTLGLGRSELQNPRESPEAKTLVSAYKTYIRSSAQRISIESNNVIPNTLMSRDINDMIRFERRLALASSASEDRRDHFGLYNRMTIRQLHNSFPGIRWLSLLRRIFKYAKVTLTDADEVVVQDSAYYRNLPSILSSTPPRVIANYLGWRFVLGYSDYTTRHFVDTYFNFQRVAYGQRKPEKAWESCYTIVDAYFPFTIGRLYVDNFFNSQSKAIVSNLVHEVRSAFSRELDEYEWMDIFTRSKAKDKLQSMLASVAFQSFIRNNSQLESVYKGMRKVDPNQFFSSVISLDRWQSITDMRKLRKAVKRESSRLSGPATVNAFNYFDLNFIQFPAGILQSPFFNLGGPASVNFGAIGKTIGHEIIHGFDDEGKQYDDQGNLRDWWTTRTEKEYNKRSECFIREYDGFREPTTGLFVNGIDTQGENLADNGGLRMAFKAYRNYIARYGEVSDPLLPARLKLMTPDQLFFLSFASIWCENERKESMRNTIKYGSHSPSRFRVIGTVINSREFAKAFRCPVGSRMNPKKKCLLW